METFYTICQWLLILALLGFFGTIAWIVFSAFQAKNAIMKDVKRLYEPPLRSGKAVVITGKGLFMQEKARVQRIGVVLKGTTASVKDTTADVTIVAKSIHPSELKSVAVNVKAVVGILGHVVSFVRAFSKQKAQSR